MSNAASKQRPRTLRNLFLGIDGGGTKTHAVIIDEDGEFVSEGVGGASNPLRVGVETAVANIFSAMEKACDAGEKNRFDIVAIKCGLAGVRRADLRQIIRERVSELTRVRKVHVVTDAEIALFGTTLGEEGLVAIAGTGSVCIGQDSSGRLASAGGWGPLAGDEGGGSGIARKALQAIAKASDGRGRPTELSEAAVDYFRAGKIENLSVAIYAPSVDNARIAGFSRLVVEKAQEGDAVAVQILEEAARELAAAAVAVIKALGIGGHAFPIGHVGSVFKAGRLVTDPFMDVVGPVAPKAFFTDPKLAPAHAAAVMAMNSFDDWPKET